MDPGRAAPGQLDVAAGRQPVGRRRLGGRRLVGRRPRLGRVGGTGRHRRRAPNPRDDAQVGPGEPAPSVALLPAIPLGPVRHRRAFISLPFDLDDLDLEHPAGGLVLDHVARRRADQRLAERRAGGDDVDVVDPLLDGADEVALGRRRRPRSGSRRSSPCCDLVGAGRPRRSRRSRSAPGGGGCGPPSCPAPPWRRGSRRSRRGRPARGPPGSCGRSRCDRAWSVARARPSRS